MMARFFVGCSLGAVLLLSPQLANAQIVGQAPALPPAAIASFLANPSQLLNQYPSGGPDLIKQVIDLVSSDKNTLASIIALARTADQDQRKSLAQALANVAKAYAAAGDPLSANQIQVAVVNSGLPDFSKAYADAAGDTGTAAAGGGGGGGGGGIAPPPTGGANTGVTTGGNITAPTITTGLLTPGGVGGGGFSCIGSNCTTLASPR
jgi:hypothetical protein